ncbi:sugar ABC transporter permease [Bacillaceae bacterium SIJ1]|uniref:carbohydrate ABC transporter permease n=1 Tax=Litoribacterium kuwaitense TaxID=1398745 RepID=UPI0013ECA137|nr:sugar ABC transporter permease [Litoribacterium kuwaitense]NGP45251.1 sugar ABC transporter permease [Litoribacterium kuwaitense]
MNSKRKDFRSALLYLSPALLIFIIFVFYPILKTFYLSFFITDRQRNPVFFNGIQNYVDMLQSPDFIETMIATLLFILYIVPGTIMISLFLAVLAHGKFKGAKIYKIIFSYTLGVSVAASAVIFRFFYHPENGLFNEVLSWLKIEKIGWLIDSNWALFSISIPTIWISIGFNFIVLTGGLHNIPKELYESAQIDGAGWWRQFKNITIPQLSPVLFFVTVILVISSFQSFAQIDLMTGGGPSGSTNLIVYSIYQDAFVRYDVGSASAQAIFLFLVILIVTYFQFKFGEKKVHYQ